VEAVRVFEGEDVSKSSKGTHTADATEQFGLWVAFAAKLFDLLVIGSDLLSEGSDGVEDRQLGGLKRFRDGWSDFASEAVRRARGQTRAGTLHDPTDVIDQQGAGALFEWSRTSASRERITARSA